MSMILEVFQEKWLMLSAVLTITWQVAEQFVLQCGAWKLCYSVASQEGTT